MPTGYTSEVLKGCSFEEYALSCARRFIGFYDESDKKDLPEVFSPTDYHIRKIEKDREELFNILSMSTEEMEEAAQLAWQMKEASRTRYKEQKRKECAAYNEMMRKVNAWVPPTPDHTELKEFMRSQLELSIDHDCDFSLVSDSAPRLTGMEWATERASELCSNILRSIHMNERAVAHAKRQTSLVRNLRESFKPKEPSND
jgi:hypothetical protein